MSARRDTPALAPIELASGIVFGTAPGPYPVAAGEPAESPLAALEHACLPALRRPPCLVSFSGGVDSSLVLAAATRAARAQGLPLPIPATNRFPRLPDTDESDWQELVVSHLGLEDWIRLELGDELDAVGQLATSGLDRHGLLWPFNAHFHAPLLEAAAGGSLLTGIGGDELFGEPRFGRALDVLSGRARPRPRDLVRVALWASPRPLRRALIARRLPAELPWLRPAAMREFTRLWAASEAGEPARLAPRARRLQASRAFRIGFRTLDLLAGDAGARMHHPLASPAFAAAVAHVAPARGFAWRGAAIRELFGDVLPERVAVRTTKVCFDGAFWGPRSRAFAASWDGSGVDPEIVDVPRLRAIWSEELPDSHTYLLLQAAWLATRSKSSKNGSLAGRTVVSATPCT
jgi:asparagine synthase (glutamine-hydrolysing)